MDSADVAREFSPGERRRQRIERASQTRSGQLLRDRAQPSTRRPRGGRGGDEDPGGPRSSAQGRAGFLQHPGGARGASISGTCTRRSHAGRSILHKMAGLEVKARFTNRRNRVRGGAVAGPPTCRPGHGMLVFPGVRAMRFPEGGTGRVPASSRQIVHRRPPGPKGAACLRLPVGTGVGARGALRFRLSRGVAALLQHGPRCVTEISSPISSLRGVLRRRRAPGVA